MKSVKQWLDIKDGHVVTLPTCGATTEQTHVFDQPSINAVNAALAAHRPLLVRGEPGTGKSQLACAVAVELNRPCLTHVVDSRTSAQDLLWTFDAVARLAEAQLARAVGGESTRDLLHVKRFVTPGQLWWALNWKSAEDQAKFIRGATKSGPDGWSVGDGAVMLIDEIDKADSDMPNGMLEVLGQGSFRPQGFEENLSVSGKMPLVVITTNEERALPDAFIRRCLVLHIELPTEAKALTELLVRRGQAHFPSANLTVLEKAAEQLVKDREDLKRRRLPAPGQAEYLDLVRAVTNLKSTPAEQLADLETIATYIMQKHPRGSVG